MIWSIDITENYKYVPRKIYYANKILMLSFDYLATYAQDNTIYIYCSDEYCGAFDYYPKRGNDYN